MTKDQSWYTHWFDSPYYYILYRARNQREAEVFIDNLISCLNPDPDSKILDVACGRGRHAVQLNKKGFDVTGFDLSRSNIDYDKQFENEKLSFYIHDMRQEFRNNYFDYVFNLFSSFGYFESHNENEAVIHARSLDLKLNGCLVLDYFNSAYIKACFLEEESKNINGIEFQIRKKIKDGFIVKEIQFQDCGHDHKFTEVLRLFTLKDFERMFRNNNLQLKDAFGDYKLEPFDLQKSERLVMIAQKI